ncbi:MAG: lamin tail domain-containing protein [Pirellulales bacterium]|nr:lamin tail domain-containing protein [Pirellulales bacterium]
MSARPRGRWRGVSWGARRSAGPAQRRSLRLEPLEPRLVLDSGVVFSEIMYHPAGGNEELEWVELHNQLAVDMDISRWSLRGGIDYTFPSGTIVPGGGYLVVAASPDALEAATGYAGAMGPYAGRLANSGEELSLYNNSDRLMNTVEYLDEAPWPVAADGSGASLALRDPDLAPELAENWTSSVRVGGTPGEANFVDEQAQGETITLLPIDATWAYNQSGTPLGTEWREPVYPDGSWPTGQALLYYEASALPAPKNTPLTLGVWTYYFRTDFDFPYALEDVASVRLRHIVDDGAAFYLNGEALSPRFNLPDGELAYNTPANSPGVDNATWSSYIDVSKWLFEPEGNVLAVEVHQFTLGSSDVVFGAELVVELVPEPPVDFSTPLVFNEVIDTAAGTFWFEVTNVGTEPIELGDYHVTSSTGHQAVLPGGSLAPGALAIVTQTQLGFQPAEGDRLFLGAADGSKVTDAVIVTDRLQGRFSDEAGTWLVPSEATPAATNAFALHDEIVINEIMYHHRPLWTPDYTESDEQWIELYNRSGHAVDLTGWSLGGGIDYEFTPGTTIPSGGYLVVARDAAALAVKYPSITIVGDYSGGLSDFGERIVLVDPAGNPADEVHYYDDGRWPAMADGGGSSLELRNPLIDNNVAEAWAASDESDDSGWQTYTYRGTATASSVGADGQWQEFILGLLEAGEVLLDDISVIETPSGTPIQLIQNGSFESGTTAAWRIIGNQHGEVIVDPDDAGNHVLRLVATGPTEHMHNHAETTLASGRTIVNGREYEISFRAKWIAGSPLLNTRLYFNRLARTTLLAQPSLHGTPGAVNSVYQAAIGPTFHDFGHGPAVPDAGEPVVVSVTAADPDAVTSMTLWYSAAGGAWTSLPMANAGGGRYQASIPGQAAATVVQFYVEGRDVLGNQATYPAEGRDSRALYKVEDGQAATNGLNNFRIIMTAADAAFLHASTNVMSNDLLGATVIYNESEVFYDVGVRLRSSERGRNQPTRVGFNIRFDADHLFLGVHRTVGIDRSGGLDVNQREMLFHQMINHAGDFTSTYNDLIKVIAPQSQHTSTAELLLTRYGDELLDTQFDNGADGAMYKYDLIYYPLTTDTGTPEGLKYPEPDNVVGTWIRNLGDDEERYRWTFLNEINLERDDYSRFIEFAKAFSLTGTSFHNQIAEYIDVDEWLRAFAFATLTGCGDNYAAGSQHNAVFYIRPEDGRVLYLPWDMDFAFDATRSLYANPDLAKLVTDPVKQRAFCSHVYDIIATTYNNDYMSYWANHYGSLLPGQDFAGYLSFINQRSSYALSTVTSKIPQVAFDVTSPAGGTLVVDGGVATVEGTGWIDVREIRVGGTASPATIAWTGLNTWRAQFSVPQGTTEYLIEAIDSFGDTIASETVTVYSPTSGQLLQDFLRITELHYNPPAPTAAEIAQGFTDGEDFEFVELTNTGPVPLDVTGVRLEDAIDHAIARAPTSPTFGFDLGPEGFTYLDDAYGTVLPDKAAGAYKPTGGYNGGGLSVLLGPGESPSLGASSGAWTHTVTMPAAGTMVLTMRYRMILGGGLETDEFGEVFFTVDGAPKGTDVNGSLLHRAGNGSATPSADDTGWLLTQFHVSLTAGTHVLTLGGYNNQATTANGYVEVRFDQITVSGADVPVLLAPGESAVLARNTAAFAARYGATTRILGVYSQKFSNSGENVVLLTPDGGTILEFEYGDGDAWPRRAKGLGSSLQVIDPAGDYDDPANWRASVLFGGTPGSIVPTPVPLIVVNEVLTHTEEPLLDAIELFNASGEPIDVGGWYLSDSGSDLFKFQIPQGDRRAVIPAGGYAVFDERDFNQGGAGGAFALDGAEGEDAWLVVADGLGLRFVDDVEFGAAASGVSLGRWPDGQGELVPMSSRTLGYANAGPRVGSVVISQLQYNPGAISGADDLEFIELFNSSNVTVDLGAWRLAGGVDLDFVAGTTIAAHATLLILPFDPDNVTDPTNAAKIAAFKNHYGLAEMPPAVGPYSGRLDNGGETVRLERLDDPAGEDSWVGEDLVRYNDDPPWPVEADGGGASLHRAAIDAWGSDHESWTAVAAAPGQGTLPTPPRVARRFLFYNDSAWDGNNPAASPDDDAAVALDKQPLEPGGVASLSNYSSYARGINGLIIDMADLPSGIAPRASDFAFRVGNNDDPSTWAACAAPVSVTVRPGEGQGGSDRVTLIWADEDAVRGQWLEVRVLGARLGLAADDVFYWGSAPGESGDSPYHAMVNATDLVGARNHPHAQANPAGIGDAYDFNRDRLVDAADVAIARSGVTSPLSALRLIRPEDQAAASAAAGDANGDGSVDKEDLAILAAHWLLREGASWANGDFNDDDAVDDLDLAILAANLLAPEA